MDEQLDRLMSVTLPQVYALGEKPVEHEIIHSLYHRITLSEPMSSVSDEELLRLKKEEMTEWLDACEREVNRNNKENIAIVTDTLFSINEMVASKNDKKEDEIVKCIRDSSSLVQQTITAIDKTIQDALDCIKDQIQMEYETKQTMLMDSFDPEYFGLEQSPVWFDFVVRSSKWLLSRAGVYLLMEQTTEKAEIGEAIKCFVTLLMPKFENIQKSIDQLKINQEIIKDKQKELENLIKIRNEADRPKKLTRAACAKIIVDILEEQYKIYTIKSDSIEKMLYRWDRALERGEKIPVQGYDSARNNKIDFFEVWAKVEFIPQYLKQRKLKGHRTRHSSSEAAFDEAARNQYKSRQRQSQYEDDDDYD